MTYLKAPSNVRILNVEILSTSLADLLASFKEGVLLTPNVDHLVRLQHDKEFFDTYANANYVICDSKIVALASKFLGTPVKEVIPGSSFFPKYCDFHKANADVKIFLLGSAEGIADLAMCKINEKYSRTLVVAAYSPSFGFESDLEECEHIVSLINTSGATVLVVGVGSPKQEKFIAKYKSQCTTIKVFMALGATIDFEAGIRARAPSWIQLVGLEWLYRLSREPRRLWKRYLVDDLPFFGYVLKQRVGKYRNPFG